MLRRRFPGTHAVPFDFPRTVVLVPVRERGMATPVAPFVLDGPAWPVTPLARSDRHRGISLGNPRHRCRTMLRHRTRLGCLPQDGRRGDGVDSGLSHHSRTGRHGGWSIGGDCSTRVHRHRRLAERGPLQENVTAPKRMEISRRNLQASRQRHSSVCSGNGVDLPAG